MTDHPMLFNTPMVRALLDGRKVQTRRVVKKQAALDALAVFGPSFLMKPGNADLVPVQIGDRIWVRETWCTGYDYDDDDKPAGEDRYFYRATDSVGRWLDPDREETRDSPPWHPSIHMRRCASRLTLVVTDVRAQRLQEISEEDARAEGADRLVCDGIWDDKVRFHQSESGTHYAGFAGIWAHTYGADSWEANPWVWALTFEVLRRNIDEVAAAIAAE